MNTRPPTNQTLDDGQRRRLRKVVRFGLTSIVGLEVLVLTLVFAVPRADALLPVFDVGVQGQMIGVLAQLGMTNTWLTRANTKLDQIEADTDAIRKREDQHSQPLGDDWEADLEDVTKTPTEKLQGISFAASSTPGSDLKLIMPGAKPWVDYHAEYLTSADTVLSTLRSSLDVLHEHNKQIEDETALQRIADLASSTDSRLAMGALKVQSNLEIARGLHALRSQHALETSLYAVTESHRIGSEARSISEDDATNCKIASALFAGPLDAPISAFLCDSP